MSRKLIAPAIYRHFKHTDDGPINNHMYAVLGVSKPLPLDEISCLSIKEDKYSYIDATHTEYKSHLLVHFVGNSIYHYKSINKQLVIYKSLNDNITCAMPLEMFLSEVDHEKYPDVEQKYRFELVTYADDAEELVYPDGGNEQMNNVAIVVCSTVLTIAMMVFVYLTNNPLYVTFSLPYIMLLSIALLEGSKNNE